MGTTDKDELPLITLRVPGNWDSPEQLGERLVTADTGYTLAWPMLEAVEPALVHTESGQRFELSVVDRDDEIADLFDHEGRLSDREMAKLRDHKVKVCVSGPGGSVEAARAVLRAGAAVIRAGGLGVFVDNCGSTHSRQDWIELAGDDSDGGVYWALVVLVGGPEMLFSIGMHCIGRRDIELPNPGDPGRAMYLMHNLLGYSYRSGIQLNDGDPMGSEEGPTHRMRHVPCERFEPGTAFHNPYGVWRLEPLAEES